MKKYFYIIISLSSLIFFLSSCKSNSTSPSDNSNNNSNSGGSYYPNTDGTSYKYSIVRTDSAGNKVSGSRAIVYSGTSVVGSVTYQNQIDTTTVAVFVNATHSLFVKDNNGVSIILDTAGFYGIIPDAYKPYVSVDQTIKIFQSSFLDGNPWTVFDMSLKEGALSLDLVHVAAVYKGMEQVPLNLSTGAVTQSAAKIQYTITLNIPNPANLLATTTNSIYTANAWLADNIGIVQIQGNAMLLDAFTGNGIKFADTTSTITQSLVSYKIK
jgi:hypothetical protein